PARYGFTGGKVNLTTYFTMARGNDRKVAMEMTKWFDTNYHYIVPEFNVGQIFSLSTSKVIDQFNEARELGIITRPVLIGPVTYLALGKARPDCFDPLDLIDNAVEVYKEVLAKLKAAGADSVQIDEPILTIDTDARHIAAFDKAYREILGTINRPAIHLATYFGDISEHLPMLAKFNFDFIHLDLDRAPEQLNAALKTLPAKTGLSLGVISGRNIWKANLAALYQKLKPILADRGSRNIIIAPSCSLQHSPVDLGRESALAPEIKEKLAFAVQKLSEVKLLTAALNGEKSALEQIEKYSAVFNAKNAARFTDPAVTARIAAISPAMANRQSAYPQRRLTQEKTLGLPLLPTTTIGSFPQTPEIRKARADFKAGSIDMAAYEQSMRDEVARVVKFQEEIGLDVLVHGEPERNDMVEYFGQQLNGFAFTQFGWVQSYGSRCVKPPLIYGDVSRSAPMTVHWAKYAQSLSKKYVKGMLTGPVTILKWSFVREDQPLSVTANQIALAIRDEVADLEDAGINIIQIDEPAFREGMPLKTSQWKEYFDWAVNAFKLATCSVSDSTQIHTHMCYSDFNAIIDAIAALDADVISIEASRSDIKLLDVFNDFDYPNEIGPGVYDIHSPRIPEVEEMVELLEKMLKVIPAKQLWVNPDCGLKTRAWPETKAALINMVKAAETIRKRAK
ncbi:MAG: 5-methyltetrahydropteroyltriglutamate--homocysteine S-methyltransferase, partial [Sedimentisphaerales bacterium]|nr:5-methyltetrahydropteroyltriglutamate--homocysteine S-methyltransferase [Sedimentisphaerales bacterium]